jgi:hypothetical protein
MLGGLCFNRLALFSSPDEFPMLHNSVGLLPTIRKALKINGRLRRYVSHDHRTSVPVGKREFVRPKLARFPKGVWYVRADSNEKSITLRSGGDSR